MHPNVVNEYVMSNRKTKVDKGKDGDTNDSGMASTLLLLLLVVLLLLMMITMMMMMIMTTTFPITQNYRKFQGFKQIFIYHDVMLYSFQNNFTSRSALHNFFSQKSRSHLKISGTRNVL
jgi:hypothetical protein